MRENYRTSFAHLALLLDLRPESREFVKAEPLLVGDPEQKRWGNTAFLKSADTSVRKMADLVMPQSHKLVIQRQKSSPELTNVKPKKDLLSGAWIYWCA